MNNEERFAQIEEVQTKTLALLTELLHGMRSMTAEMERLLEEPHEEEDTNVGHD